MSETTTAGVLARLEAAATELDDATAAVEEIGEARVERLAEVHERFDALLSRHRETASGSGSDVFEAYVEFQDELERFADGLPEDLLHREAFEAAVDVLDRRRLDERDFDAARGKLGAVTDVLDRRADREAARRRYAAARRAVRDRLETVEAELDDRESVLAFADVDLDAPVGVLREPIDAYDAAVSTAFRTFRREAAAVDVLDLVATTEAYPLVDYPPPPTGLGDYLRSHPAGAEPIPTLLEWAEYTRSKLDHYVDDPAPFRAAVAGNRTYLDRLDAEPLTVGWPPPPAGTLRYRGRELVAVVERFAPPATVARLNDVRDLARRDDYGRLRRAAVAADRLDETDRRRLADGTVQDEVEALREERERLAAALEEYPAP